MIKKIIIFFLIAILVFVSYHYLQPPYKVKNSEARNLGYKVKPLKDSIYIFIPYKITVYNNRPVSLKIGGIYDENSTGRALNLLYNEDGIELCDFLNTSKKQYDKLYKNKLYHELNRSYKNNIFPFTKRNFYYYKRHTISNKNDSFGIKNISRDSIYTQLAELSYNFEQKNRPIIDSVYTANHQKIFNVDFRTGTAYKIKSIKAKLHSNKQIAININYHDSTKNMNRDQETNYMIKKIKTNMKLDDF